MWVKHGLFSYAIRQHETGCFILMHAFCCYPKLTCVLHQNGGMCRLSHGLVNRKPEPVETIGDVANSKRPLLIIFFTRRCRQKFFACKNLVTAQIDAVAFIQ